MEEEPSDPHEQQLFAVFKSCLVEGQSELNKDGLLALCSKLELEENHKDAILELLEINVVQRSVSFYEFRDSFLALLGKSQETPGIGSEKEVNSESQTLYKNNTMCTFYSHQSAEKKQSEAMNCQQLQTGKIFDQQRLQETWSNQNSLTIEDVNSFCNRGFVLPKQTIELIFEKLDLDCDGLINLDEFLHFFQSANGKFHEQSNLNWSTYLHRDNTKSDCKDFAYHQTGHVLRNVIIELWEVAGVSEANSLLLDLGFDAPTINLIDLSNALSSELKLHHDVSHAGGIGEYARLLKGALTLYQEEVRNLNTTVEHLCCERDKLRADISEANERANLLAQEIDEHQTRMDKSRQEQLRQLELKHSEALKDLTKQLHLERERSTNGLRSLEEQLLASQSEEQRIRDELATVLQELRLLETENQNQNEEIGKLEVCNGQLSLQIRQLAAAHDQVESIETRENEQLSDLMSHIKRLQGEMKILRDHNDELTTELEMLKHQDNDLKSIVSSVEIRSTISDENDGLISIPTTEVSDTEDEDKQQQQQYKFSDHSKMNKVTNANRRKVVVDESSNGNSINKLTEIIQEFRNFLTGVKFCTECSILRNEVSSLISKLEFYQSSVPVTSTTPKFSKRKKHLKNLANELEAECKNNERLSESCRDLVVPRNEKFKHYKRISSSDDTIHDLLDDNLDNSDVKCIAKNKLSGLRDYPPRKDLERDKSAGKSGTINNLDIKRQNVEATELLREEELKHAAEKKQLIDRCGELEKSLEMLKAEYEQCEDYWAAKLEEERQIFEQEQKISDEKLAELISKMAEYEEQFSGGDKSRDDGRLSPIEERLNLEQQYNDLEDEFERWRAEAQDELANRDREIEELKTKLRNEKSSSLADFSVQFPDDQMCLHSENDATEPSSSGRDESQLFKEIRVNSARYCPQCHKLIMQNSCDCHVNTQRHQHQHYQVEMKNRKIEGKGKHHYHQHQKRVDGDLECSNLLKEKEKLKQEIMKLQSLKTINTNNMYPLIGTEDQNMLSNLYRKLCAQEQKHKYLQIFYQTQQKDNERILQGMWKQHLLETADLRFVIKTTEEKLNEQIKLNKEQNEKLTKADFLTKELYVENAQLSETIKRLDQHCQILTQNHIEPSSA